MTGTVKFLLPPMAYPDKETDGSNFYKIAFELEEEIGNGAIVMLPDNSIFMITHKEGGRVMAESVVSYTDEPKVYVGMKVFVYDNAAN